MNKECIFGQGVRDGLKSGTKKLVDPVRITLGAKGRLVGIYDSRYGSHITKDGFQIAKSFDISDNKLEALAIDMVNQAIKKTNDLVGDATTTTAILCQELITRGLNNISNDADPLKLKEGIDTALEFAVKEIAKASIPIDNRIKEIAKISGNNKEFIGETIAKAFEFSGLHAESSIEVLATDDNKTSISTVSGYQLDKGFLRDDFINHKDGKCVYHNPLILMVHATLTSFRDFIPLLNKIAEKEKRPLVIVADKFDGEFLNSVLVSMSGQMAQYEKDTREGKQNLYFQQIGLIQNPMALQSAAELYTDIGTIVDYKGSHLKVIIDDINIEDLGSADYIEIGRASSFIKGGHGEKSKIKDRIEQLKVQLDDEKELTPFQKDVLNTRIKSLAGTHSYIRVGGSGPAEMKEAKDLFDDALNAVRSSIKEGITAGGGSTLLRIADKMRSNLPKDIHIARGWDIFIESIEAPFYQVMKNANEKADVIKDKILNSDTKNCGYNVLTKEYVDMIKAGIIDPAMAERVSLENAVAVSGLMYNMGAVVLEKI